MKYLGIDFGEKRIGLALGDGESRTAVPHRTLKFDQEFWRELLAVVAEEEIDEIVVGLPRSLRGGKGGMERAVSDFLKELRARIPLPIHKEDERMSTALAERLLRGSKSGDKDAVAASVILQTYLDRIK